MGTEFVLQVGKSWETGCATTWLYLTLLILHLKPVKTVNCMLHVF